MRLGNTNCKTNVGREAKGNNAHRNHHIDTTHLEYRPKQCFPKRENSERGAEGLQRPKAGEGRRGEKGTFPQQVMHEIQKDEAVQRIR